MRRIYYCYQMGDPTFPAGEIVVETRRPQSMKWVAKIRAENVPDARAQYEREWNTACQHSLARRED